AGLAVSGPVFVEFTIATIMSRPSMLLPTDLTVTSSGYAAAIFSIHSFSCAVSLYRSHAISTLEGTSGWAHERLATPHAATIAATPARMPVRQDGSTIPTNRS